MDETGLYSVGYEIPVQDFLMWAQGKGFLVPKRLCEEAQGQVMIGGNEEGTAAQQARTPQKILKPAALDKVAVQTAARCLWDQYPKMTNTDIVKHRWVQNFANGKLYKGKNTLRDWIREVDPRPPNEKNGRPKKMSENIPSD